MVRTLGYKYLKLVHAFGYHKLLAKSTEMQWIYVIHVGNHVDTGGSDTEMSPRSWIQTIIYRNCLLAANTDSMQCLYNC